GQLERASTDAVEAAVLAPHVGSVFDGVIVDVHHDGDGSVQVADPAVLARVAGPVTLGAATRGRLVTADVATRTVRFAVACPRPPERNGLWDRLFGSSRSSPDRHVRGCG